jgi:hypothetical protein
MKVLYCGVFICLMMGTLLSYPARADGMTSIQGYVKDGDTHEVLSDVEIAFTNMVTLETVYIETEQTGYYEITYVDFLEGVSNGDSIKILIQVEGYCQYYTTVRCDSNYQDPMILDINLYEATQGGPTNPYADPVCLPQITCFGSETGLTVDWQWGHPDNAPVSISNSYDGVEFLAGCLIQDNGNHVPYGKTFKIFVVTAFKIERLYAPTHIYYSDDIAVMDPSTGFDYYIISKGESVTIDPIHDVKLLMESNPPGFVWGIKNHWLKMTDTVSIQIHDITDDGDTIYQDWYYQFETHNVLYTYL